ncbi:hypothetical protein EUGRSUZ_C00928 [Eucalyptus grandis]|uniref:Uncharacterized protein n=2 Tax=Eucalyptus grandis TaxID=71139 RepID=A0ACC3LCK3_EUCGR|nr:hypothetical protein EUGRSUZ_C00928 [Eucalyptus grandis]
MPRPLLRIPTDFAKTRVHVNDPETYPSCLLPLNRLNERFRLDSTFEHEFTLLGKRKIKARTRNGTGEQRKRKE